MIARSNYNANLIAMHFGLVQPFIYRSNIYTNNLRNHISALNTVSQRLSSANDNEPTKENRPNERNQTMKEYNEENDSFPFLRKFN